jgi:hypothetical protein
MLERRGRRGDIASRFLSDGTEAVPPYFELKQC